jgi:hypothetical protein
VLATELELQLEAAFAGHPHDRRRIDGDVGEPLTGRDVGEPHVGAEVEVGLQPSLPRATSNEPPPATVATPRTRAAASLRRLIASLATIQQAMESFKLAMRWALCSRWPSRMLRS